MTRPTLKRLLPKSPIARRATLVAVVPVALFLLVLLIFGFDQFVHRGRVLRNVTLGGESISGLNEEEVRAAVDDVESQLTLVPALFVVNDREFALDPMQVGLAVDADSVVDEAMRTGREGGPLRRFGDWFRQLRTHTEVPIAISVDDTAIEQVFEEWETEAIEATVSNGSIRVAGGQVVRAYPTKGLGIERVQGREMVRATLVSLDRPRTELPLVVLQPSLTDADVDAAAAEAALVVEGPVTLSKEPDLSLTFTPDQLGAAFRSNFVAEPQPKLELSFDPVTVEEFLAPLRAQLELPPLDARFQINDDDSVTLIPGRPGTKLDAAEVAVHLYAATLEPSRSGELPVIEGAQPEFTTEAAQAMMPMGLMSEFTTKHACCQARVTNIQLFADLVNGMVIQPGAVFSLNEAVGLRTVEKGFVAAPMIQEGILEDSIGGGVSQFATTFFNAVFWGGYEDVEHTPHSIYIERYPELVEATISWPKPDLKFRNDSDAIIIIQTRHTDTSITVRFFGNNGGRKIEKVINERTNYTQPVVRYEANDEIKPGTEEVITRGSQGWSVTGLRIITYPDGRVVEQKLAHRYSGEVRKLQVHSCNMPDATVECPIEVPALIGLDPAAAAAAAAAAGLSTASGPPVAVPPESGLGGKVAMQNPAAGTLVPKSTVITINIGTVPPEATTTTTPATTTTAAP